MNKSHLTAITRKKPSLPTQYLYSVGLLYGEILDYGCGRGFDASYYFMDKYDKYYHPAKPKKLYDTIICNYVLNVVDLLEGEDIIKDIKSMLKHSGIAYITVRRDKYNEGFTHKGTYQRHVVLDLPVVKECKGKYIIYEVCA